MTGDSLTTDLAAVIFSAAGGSILLVGGLLAVGMLGSAVLSVVLGPRPRGGRRLSVRQMLRAAKGSEYAPQRILNRSEHALARDVERLVRTHLPGYRVLPQLSLSEVVRPAGTSARARHSLEAVLGRSLDLAVVDRQGFVVHAIEYQGMGHYQGNAEIRDAIKAEILRKAGIDLIAVPARWDPAWLERRLSMSPVARRRHGRSARAAPIPEGAPA